MSQFMQALFEKKKPKLDKLLCLIEITFPKRFPHSDKHSWGISYEYLPGWPEPAKEEIIMVCLCHVSYLHKVVYVANKKHLSIPEAAITGVL